MDLNKKQKDLYSRIDEGSKESIAVSESMGMSHAFAKLSEKVEIINLMLIPALQSAGMVAGEVKDLYSGKGPDNAEMKIHLSNVVQSVSVLASLFEIPMSDIVESAFKEKE
ncbi:MAG: hypothetical protein PF518_04775 [Spirochaetaceae bacterium]|jgi:hypothetical protein|nr:hypothetical protein [Spirochaetaceae bacterium]